MTLLLTVNWLKMVAIGKECSIVVNSFDSYDDCWHPFFTLLERYWPDNECKIYLISNNKKYKFNNINSLTPNRNIWSGNLLAALKEIKTPYIIYMQEDYFFEKYVNISKLQHYWKILVSNSNIGYLELTPYGARSSNNSPENEIINIPKYSRYRSSTQIAFWKREVLIDLLRVWENGWEFELYGSLRSAKETHKFCSVNKMYLYEDPIFSYRPTGIVKGQWMSFVPQLMKKEGININYNKRGFYSNPSSFMRRILLLKQLIMRPKEQLKSIISLCR